MCGHRHHHPRPIQQERSLRVSDRERDEVTTQLRDHAAEGRLTPEELDERVERALGARTGADLDAVLADLPRRRTAVERREGVLGLSGLVAITVLLVSVWLVTGAGYFWPVWVIGFMAFSLLRRGRLRGAHWA